MSYIVKYIWPELFKIRYEGENNKLVASVEDALVMSLDDAHRVVSAAADAKLVFGIEARIKKCK